MSGDGAGPDNSPVASTAGFPPGLIRGALQLALRVAREGLQADPPVEPPRSMARMLAFNRHPDAALVAVRRTLDSDEAFRGRVAAVAAGGDHGLERPSLLFLTRPPGWEAELGQLTAEAQTTAAAAQEEREERDTRRKLARAEAALRQAEQARALAEQRATRAEAALADDRRRRRSVEQEARQSLERARSELRAEVRAEVRAETETATGRAERAAAEADALRARVASLERELALATALPPVGTAPHQALRAALAAVTAAGEALEGALEEIPRTGGPAAPSMANRSPGSAGPPESPKASVRRQGGRRRPAALPPGVFDDSVEAADHLVRVPGILLLVDGYNVAMYCWPEVAPAELRRRLVAALEELATRAGTEALVVWDSSEAIERAGAAVRRRLVREVFSPPDPDIEADDIILAEVAHLPAEQQVVVASSDRRVADGARGLGANVISSPQLAAVLGRRPS